MKEIPKNMREFIRDISCKLSVMRLIREDITYISGAELKLTGFNCDHKGQPFVDDKSYELAVPVYKVLNHETNLQVAYLAHGLTGIYNYLADYLTKDQLQDVKNFFMSVNNAA